MNLKHLTITNKKGIKTITISREEKRNALSPEVLVEISEVLGNIENDSDTHVIILTGGEKYFSAGFDLQEIRKLEKIRNETYTAMFHRTYRSILFCPLPVICAVGGPAIAGGFDLTMMCDIRYASEKAKFGQREIALSLTPILDPLWRIVGLGRAKELTLTGRIYSAEEAKAMGYVNDVFPENELLQHVTNIAQNMAQFDRQALIETKQLSNQVLSQDLDTSMRMQEWLFRSFIGSEDNHRRIDSLMETLSRKS
jgi:enoyl-CoA hydratase/carnithine racemase